ncbi:RNA polymerase sigma factor [Cellulosimicrobium arenosum]|uniref:RNA polymerase sigma factor n=1 Tax=Cellulosimicrobium arenosum TaxID=2708133 RepID=A0A927J0Y2_9MICO|nr:RNA polymerase sigma factor [Cellulosimicrobium arenosum]MBD8079856.1 RNA polymerase sigma factor [Cellulosimicrobium arenosum]
MSAPAPPPPPDDRHARFTALFDATHRPLLAYAVRRVASPADAADVVAEAFVVAWRRIDEVPSGADARPWMFGVARRILANARRGDQRRLALADRLRTQVVEVVPPPDEGTSDVERALARLGDDDQELLRLVAWEELARDEIALVLGISRGTVRVRLHRARRRLVDQLRALSEAGDHPPAPARSADLQQNTTTAPAWASPRTSAEEA